ECGQPDDERRRRVRRRDDVPCVSGRRAGGCALRSERRRHDPRLYCPWDAKGRRGGALAGTGTRSRTATSRETSPRRRGAVEAGGKGEEKGRPVRRGCVERGAPGHVVVRDGRWRRRIHVLDQRTTKADHYPRRRRVRAPRKNRSK